MDFNKFFQSRGFRVATWTVATIIVFLLIFRLGIAVGYRKAAFSYRWGENYHRNFGGPRGGFARDFMNDRMFTESHGVFGTVVSVDPSTSSPQASSGQAAIIMKGSDDVEKIIQVTADTVITRLRERIAVTDLKTDDPIVVIGNPNDMGQIEAKLIRVMPMPMTGPTMIFRR